MFMNIFYQVSILMKIKSLIEILIVMELNVRCNIIFQQRYYEVVNEEQKTYNDNMVKCYIPS